MSQSGKWSTADLMQALYFPSGSASNSTPITSRRTTMAEPQTNR